MSYTTWHTYGYGIRVSDILEKDVQRLEKLISLAPKYQAEIEEWLVECGIPEPAYEDYLEFDQDYMLGLATILKEVILEAEGIELTACDGYDGDEYLLYCPDYPWNQAKRKQLESEAAVEKLFQKYVPILTDEPITVEYRSVENGG